MQQSIEARRWVLLVSGMVFRLIQHYADMAACAFFAEGSVKYKSGT